MTGQYIAATFDFHRIKKSIDATHPGDTEKLDSLRMEKAQKLAEVRHFQQHPLVMEFSKAIRDSQQKETQRDQIQDMQNIFDSTFSQPSTLPVPGRLQPTGREPPPIPTRKIHPPYPGRFSPLTTPSKVPSDPPGGGGI